VLSGDGANNKAQFTYHVDCNEQCRVEISSGPTVLESLDAELDVSRTWSINSEINNIIAKEFVGYYELKNHTPFFHEGRSE
jgi:hypothetical protein